MSFTRISGIAAIGFATLIVIGNVIVAPAGLPLAGAGIEEVDEFFSTEGDILGIGSALAPAAWVLAALSGTGAVAALWRHERERGEAWSILGLAGLVMQNMTFAGIG